MKKGFFSSSPSSSSAKTIMSSSGQFGMQARRELFDEMVILVHFYLGLYSGKCREERRREEREEGIFAERGD
jgi:hypothetical protein